MPSFWSLDFLSKVFCNLLRWGVENFIFEGVEYVGLNCHHARRTTHRRGTWLILGLRKYKNVHGRWPASLEDVSEYVPGETFLDPINGGAFVYVLEGDSFKIYSKGPNGIDEGGRDGYVRALKRSEDDMAIWPSGKQEAENEKAGI